MKVTIKSISVRGQRGFKRPGWAVSVTTATVELFL